MNLKILILKLSCLHNFPKHLCLTFTSRSLGFKLVRNVSYMHLWYQFENRMRHHFQVIMFRNLGVHATSHPIHLHGRVTTKPRQPFTAEGKKPFTRKKNGCKNFILHLNWYILQILFYGVIMNSIYNRLKGIHLYICQLAST